MFAQLRNPTFGFHLIDAFRLVSESQYQFDPKSNGEGLEKRRSDLLRVVDENVIAEGRTLYESNLAHVMAGLCAVLFENLVQYSHGQKPNLDISYEWTEGFFDTIVLNLRKPLIERNNPNWLHEKLVDLESILNGKIDPFKLASFIVKMW